MPLGKRRLDVYKRQGYGGGAIFLDGKGAVRFGKNAFIANNESYHYGGAIYLSLIHIWGLFP